MTVKASKDRWEKEVYDPAVAKHPERLGRFITTSSEEVDHLYIPDPAFDYDTKLGMPGSFPYTRGIHPTMYRGRLWTMRQFSGFGSAVDTNSRFKYLLAHGETGLSIAFDYPTLYGRDSDHELAEGEFGKTGVAISHLGDMQVLFDGIPMRDVSTSMTINGPASVMWALYIATATAQGAELDQLRGTTQNDILKEYIAQKSYIFPPAPAMRLIIDTFEYGTKHVPNWNTISISGYHIREAGSTALQELAFTLADGREYVRQGIERGLDVDTFAPRLSFFFNAHNDLFEEIAKFRAARRVWAKVMRDQFGATKLRSQLLRFHTQTAGVSLTAQQPEVNIVRVTIQALAAVLGGTQSLHTNSMDEALALPSEKAVRIALRTQQVIAHESGITNTIDPLGGSYLVEELTDRMEEGVWRYFARIDELGGVIPAIERGFFQREITDAAFRFQQEIETGERIVVGVNDFVLDEDVAIGLLDVDEAGEIDQMNRLKRLRADRDASKWQAALDHLRKVAEGDENTMPALLAAVHAKATIGETTDVLREVFGEYREPAFY